MAIRANKAVFGFHISINNRKGRYERANAISPRCKIVLWPRKNACSRNGSRDMINLHLERTPFGFQLTASNSKNWMGVTTTDGRTSHVVFITNTFFGRFLIAAPFFPVLLLLGDLREILPSIFRFSFLGGEWLES
jgi:hypothetical protein